MTLRRNLLLGIHFQYSPQSSDGICLPTSEDPFCFFLALPHGQSQGPLWILLPEIGRYLSPQTSSDCARKCCVCPRKPIAGMLMWLSEEKLSDDAPRDLFCEYLRKFCYRCPRKLLRALREGAVRHSRNFCESFRYHAKPWKPDADT